MPNPEQGSYQVVASMIVEWAKLLVNGQLDEANRKKADLMRFARENQIDEKMVERHLEDEKQNQERNKHFGR